MDTNDTTRVTSSPRPISNKVLEPHTWSSLRSRYTRFRVEGSPAEDKFFTNIIRQIAEEK
jgi:hypothetical protein